MTAQTRDLTCRELVEFLTEYLEGTLTPADRLKFDEHLTLCEGCRIYLDQMRTAIGTLGKLREELIPPQAMEDLLRVFRASKA